MYIHTLNTQGFRCFEKNFTVNFNNGLNVIVGENGAGKTAIISALRQLFIDSESGRYSVTEQDFNKSFFEGAIAADAFSIEAIFSDLEGSENIAFLPWCDNLGNATLNLKVENRELRGRFKRELWGGQSRATAFDPETLDLIHCIYLPPLRDAESKLSNGRQSRLSKLLKALNRKKLEEYRKKGELHPLVKKVAEFNAELSESSEFTIKHANKLITENLKKAVGHHFGQNTLIQFTESDFTKIVESLRLLFFPDLTVKNQKLFRSLQENSLGYNNLLYIASILAEMIADDEGNGVKQTYFKLLLIEEPEAHLHPQLQTRLLKHLSEVAKNKNVQVIVTSHSTVLASSVPVDSIIHLSCNDSDVFATPLIACDIPDDSKRFIDRWLDVTKSNLLFASGVILVEGIAEQMLLPELAKVELKNQKNGSQSLDDLGVSVINLNGIYFQHFMRLYCNLKRLPGKEDQDGLNIPIRCAGLTDLDPQKEDEVEVEGKKEKIKVVVKPHDESLYEGKNHAIAMVDTVAESEYARLFVNKYKTFEYDLAMEGNNIQVMAEILHDEWPTDGIVKAELKLLKEENWREKTSIEKAEASFEILKRVEDTNIGKGLFAQLLAEKLSNSETSIVIPKYIKEAIHWACSTQPIVEEI